MRARHFFGKYKNKRMKTLIAVIVAVVLCIGIVFYFYNNLLEIKQVNNRPCTDMTFDARLWKDSVLIRGRMVNNLIESKRLISLHRDSVIRLLGTPSNDTLNLMSYWFDKKCGNKENPELMIFYIEVDSAQNKVTDNWITD